MAASRPAPTSGRRRVRIGIRTSHPRQHQAYPRSSRDCGHQLTERRYPMHDEVRAFVISSLKDMNYDVEGVDDATTLGPAGLDLESLALSDLLMRAEDEYHIRFA